MRPKDLKFSVFIVIVIVVITSMATSAMAWKMWKSDTNPGNTQPPGGTWVEITNGVSLGISQSVWIAIDNVHIAENTKQWWAEVIVPAGGATFSASDWTGYYNGGGSQSTTTPISVEVVPGTPMKTRWNFESTPQPDWEVVKITRTAKGLGELAQVDVEINGNSSCSATPRIDPATVYIDNLRHGASYDSLRITEVLIFHATAMMDTNFAPLITAPIGSGTWTYEFVYTDPDGNPRPQGAVRWSTDGPGIQPEQAYDIKFTMAYQAYGIYSLYVFDSTDSVYIRTLVPVESQIPTLTEWGLIVLLLMIVAAAIIVFRKQRRVQPA